jgi:MoxR-like ATPase
MTYTKMFNPHPVARFDETETEADQVGDRRDGSVYVYSDDIVLAVNVAMATRRPLLVRGPSGSGKSSLAHNVAKCLGRRYHEVVMSSRTQARDLLYDIDYLRRLHDAQLREKIITGDLSPYVVPRVLWWAFDYVSADRQSHSVGAPAARQRVQLNAIAPEQTSHAAVVLIDEVDKADPEVPNNLLVPLGSLQFTVEETGLVVGTTREHAPLVILTTNDERELPQAFLRRCVAITLPPPDRSRLIQIARAHFPDVDLAVLEKLGAAISSTEGSENSPPSVAEFLDLVLASRDLDVAPGSALWDSLTRIAVGKSERNVAGRR